MGQNSINEEPLESEEFSCDDTCLVIGRLAVKYGFVSEKQVREALSLQKQGSRKCLLGETLFVRGLISNDQLDCLLSAQNFSEIRQKEKKFGMIAFKNGFATQKEINLALEEQAAIFEMSESVKLIGDILVESKVLTSQQRDAVLLRQQRLGLLLKQPHKRNISTGDK